VVVATHAGSMVVMESTLSIIATIISSVALIGVAAGLILQSQQLKASRIQVMREMHLELMKIGIDNPALAGSLYEDIDLAEFPRATLLNFLMTSWQTMYLLKMFPRKSLELQAAQLFASEHARNWWLNLARDSLEGVGTKLEREFFTVVDGAYQNVVRTLQAASHSDVSSSSGEE
jgi:hypothetical protein